MTLSKSPYVFERVRVTYLVVAAAAAAAIAGFRTNLLYSCFIIPMRDVLVVG